jgi:hypothetical protein
LVGKNANRSTRAPGDVGAVLFFIAMWLLARMTLVSGPEQTSGPGLRGVGLGLIFVH